VITPLGWLRHQAITAHANTSPVAHSPQSSIATVLTAIAGTMELNQAGYGSSLIPFVSLPRCRLRQGAGFVFPEGIGYKTEKPAERVQVSAGLNERAFASLLAVAPARMRGESRPHRFGSMMCWHFFRFIFIVPFTEHSRIIHGVITDCSLSPDNKTPKCSKSRQRKTPCFPHP
jgi:hypothetical protein